MLHRWSPFILTAEFRIWNYQTKCLSGSLFRAKQMPRRQEAQVWSGKTKTEDPKSSTMKQVQPQQPTNIAWCFPTSSAAPGQINQSRNSRAKKKEKKGEGAREWGMQERGEAGRQGWSWEEIHKKAARTHWYFYNKCFIKLVQVQKSKLWFLKCPFLYPRFGTLVWSFTLTVQGDTTLLPRGLWSAGQNRRCNLIPQQPCMGWRERPR